MVKPHAFNVLSPGSSPGGGTNYLVDVVVAYLSYIQAAVVRFHYKVQKIYIGGIGIQRLKAKAQVIHQKWLQVRILYINLLIWV